MALKSHWWWFNQYVFNKILPSYNGYVVFLEEDHIVSPDFYRVLQWMTKTAPNAPEKIWGIALADLSGRPGSFPDPDTFEYRGGYTNTGYAYTRELWNAFQQNEEEFWSFPDGWDWTFYHFQQRQLIPQLFLLPTLSRIKNVGREGIN